MLGSFRSVRATVNIMKRKYRFRQCLLQRHDGEGTVFFTTSWLPEHFGVVGRELSLRNGEYWVDGWKVMQAGPPVDDPPDWRRLIRGHRKMTGDALPRRT